MVNSYASPGTKYSEPVLLGGIWWGTGYSIDHKSCVSAACAGADLALEHFSLTNWSLYSPAGAYTMFNTAS